MPVEPVRRPRRSTATSEFGVGRREGHDASEFYRRFTPPVLSTDDNVCHPDDRRGVDRVFLGDIRQRLDDVAPRSVALVVTSPPYYSGKAYETAIGEGHIPAGYTEYLSMLTGVFAACVEVMEPGGRIAVNVANLGRKPYRSLSADVIRILEDELGLLLRGEVVWRKAKGAAGSCAWGTYQRPGDPVLRDLTERVVIASKGRFDRAVGAKERAARGLPSEGSIYRDEFMEATLDVWDLPSERATRVGHPAPFPVELPQRLIDLYTYRGDLILDPFMGSGTTAIAALRTDRHFIGFDMESEYVALSLQRIEGERERLAETHVDGRDPLEPAIRPHDQVVDVDLASLTRAIVEGRRARELAHWLIEDAGFTITKENARMMAGATVHFETTDGAGRPWLFDVCGEFSTGSIGLSGTDMLLREVGKATLLSVGRPDARLVLLATEVPDPKSAAGKALASITGAGQPVHAVYDLRTPGTVEELRKITEIA